MQPQCMTSSKIGEVQLSKFIVWMITGAECLDYMHCKQLS